MVGGIWNLSRSNELLVLQRLGRDQCHERVAEEVIVVPVVEAEGHLVKVGVHVLRRELVIRADNRPFQQAPDLWDANIPSVSGALTC